METLIIVGESKYTTLNKMQKVSNQMWDWNSLVDYCYKNNLNYFTIDDYCDTINGVSDEDCSIDFSNAYLQYCNVTL
jgi:hypothetical protein